MRPYHTPVVGPAGFPSLLLYEQVEVRMAIGGSFLDSHPLGVHVFPNEMRYSSRKVVVLIPIRVMDGFSARKAGQFSVRFSRNNIETFP